MNDWIEELIAQVEAHGADSVRLFLGDSGPNGEDLELHIQDVVYDGTEDEVRVIVR